MKLPSSLAVTRHSARTEIRPLTASALLGVLGVAADLARPWPLAAAIDALVNGHGSWGLSANTELLLAAVALVLVTGFAGWLEMHAVIAAERAAERVGARVRSEVFDGAIVLSPRWHDRMRSGELVSRVTTDVGRVLDALVAVYATLVPDLVRLVVVLIVLFVFNPLLALVALAITPALAALAVHQRRLVRTAEVTARAESGRFNGVAVDLIRNVRAVQAFAYPQRVFELFRERNTALFEASTRAAVTEARWAPVADVTLAVGSGLVLLVAGHQVLAGQLSTGDLVVISSYISALYSPVRALSRISGVVAKSGASAARLDEVLRSGEQVSEQPNAVPAPGIHRAVQLVNVRFGYQPDRPVFSDINLTLSAGETVCLLGPSGAGKSTILHLLLRLYDVDAGAILLDGVDVRDMQLSSLRRRIAFVPQDPWLFDTTIADNIAFAAVDATRHRILQAAREALVDEFVGRLPHGYDTQVGEGGGNLSGGQRRRVALARAAMSDAPLVLLDEPTASLDAHSRDGVLDGIRRSTQGRTVLFVTHDHSATTIADRVLTLEHDGTHGLRLAEPLNVRGEVFA